MNLRQLGRLIFRGKAATEGAYRPGPYYIEGGTREPSGWLSASGGRFWNWWQMGYRLQGHGEGGAMVEACVSAYAQTVAMCPGDHWLASDDGGRERVTTSALARIIHGPNDYQSMSDLLLNMTRALYTKGEAFAVAIRNNRFEIDELHWMRNGYPNVAEDGSIFYSLSGNEIVERRYDTAYPIPSRDVLHVRLHTPRHPLKGESPVCAATMEMALAGTALSQQVAFYLNQARPSFVLETDKELKAHEAHELRQRWDAQTLGEHAGGTPIASWGLKVKPVIGTAVDAQLAEMLTMTDQHIALVFRIPLQILGIGGTPFASTEALMSSWKASGLGFALNHIEESIGQLFGLKGFPEEYIEFNTDALLRSSFKEVVDSLSTATRRVMTINEARRKIDLAAMSGCDEILVQQQDIPISLAGKMQQSKPPSGNAPAGDGTQDGGDPAGDAASKQALEFFRSAHARSLAA